MAYHVVELLCRSVGQVNRLEYVHQEIMTPADLPILRENVSNLCSTFECCAPMYL
jgi:hypothetical protein